ncbi:MAG: hypothetical protein U5K75_10375 [Ahrensia sp.]|nr:hypothetical protein [Ahrensia sp.]
MVDPINFENQVQGGVVWGLGHAMNCEITYLDGQAEQTNFDAHEGMRLYQCPIIEVRGLENGNKVRGIGEPPVPPAAAALANAIFAATGKRIREMPFNKHIDFCLRSADREDTNPQLPACIAIACYFGHQRDCRRDVGRL